MDSEILQGWKAIEKFIGLKRKAIIARGYPIRRELCNGMVFAFRDELLEHLNRISSILPQIATESQRTPKKDYNTH